MMEDVLHQRHLQISGGIFSLCAAVGLVLPGSFLLQKAGPALDVTGNLDGIQLLDISGAETYPTETKLFMTTVSSFGNAEMGVSGVQALGALVFRDQQLVPVRAMYSRQESAKEVEERSAAMMTSSQDSGTVAGLQAAGYSVPMTLTVSGVSKGSPAEGKFEEGDVLVSITVGTTTTAITTFSDLSGVLFSVDPGTTVTLGFTRGGESSEATMQTQAYQADSTGWVHPGSRLGLYIASSDVKFPVDVNYGVKDIGGPSAGSMFALAIYDKLTEGSLGDDERIAGTGTMSYNGDIGPRGGISHKLVGAAEEGAEYFLAPAENCEETIGYEPDGVKIFAVRNLGEAIAAATAIGQGDTSGLTTCRDMAR